MTGSSLQISVVIPTYQRCKLLRRTLEHLMRQTLPAHRFEVVVSIDGSEDGTREMVGSFHAPYRLQALWQPNQGRAAACNAGLRRAVGELVVLLDDDMEPAPGFLEAHTQAHAAHPRLGVMGAVPIPLDEGASAVVRYVASKFNSHLERLATSGAGITLRDYYTGNFSISRRILLEQGGFDPAFMLYGNEDLELCYRLAKAGVSFTFSPEALAHQRYTKDFSGLAHDHVGKGRTSVLLLVKHPSALSTHRLSTYGARSRRWRFLRAVLLNLSLAWAGLPRWIIRAMQGVRWVHPEALHPLYDFVLDYCYWWGVASELRTRSERHANLGRPARAAGESPR